MPPGYTRVQGDPMKTVVASCLLVVALASSPVAAEQPMLGHSAPVFRLKDLDDNVVSLADLRGRMVVVHFGASW